MEAAIKCGLPYAITGKDGRYTLHSPAFGESRITAEKSSEGYPDLTYSLFASDTKQDVTKLTASDTPLVFDIHLPPPDGILEGTAVDAKSGKVISAARITLRREEWPFTYISANVASSGSFLSALPERPIRITINAAGHLPWSYESGILGRTGLTLASREHKAIKVALIPETSGGTVKR